MSKSNACLILIAFIMLFSFVSALEPITVERELPKTAEAGETIQVTLTMKFIGEIPSGIIITEIVPEGWEITGSLPAFTEFENNVSWLLYGDNIKNSSIIYELKVGETFNNPQMIQGHWETLTESELISGDKILIPKTEETKDNTKEKETAPQDYTILIIIGIGIIVLASIITVFAIKKKK